MTVEPRRCRDAMCVRAASWEDAAYHAVDRPPAEIAGLTTTSAAGSSTVPRSASGVTHVVGTIGRPAAPRSRRYALSRFHATTSWPLTSVVTPPTAAVHARYSSGRSTLSHVLLTRTR